MSVITWGRDGVGAVRNNLSRDIEASHILQEETKSAKSDDEEAEEMSPETKEDKEESKDSEESEEEPEPEPSQSEAPGAEVSQSASPEDESNQSEKDKEAIPSETKESVSLVVDFLSHLRRVYCVKFHFFSINFNWWTVCNVFPCYSFNS